MPSKATGELPALTVLRFVLALYALAYHVLFAWNPGRASPLVSAGFVSVSGFFVLSGFVLAYRYVDTDNGRLRDGARRFYGGRFARIYPVHLVGLVVSIPLFVTMARTAHAPATVIVSEAWREALAVGLLVQAWIPERALDLNGPTWSLSVEVFFYAAFPLLVRLFLRLRMRGLFVASVAAYVVVLALPLAFPLENGIADGTERDRVLLFNPLVHLPEFALGVTTGLGFVRTRPSATYWGWVACGAGALLLACLALSGHVPVGLLHNGLLDPLMAVLIFALAAAVPARDGRARGASGGAVLLLGHASYSLYVLHKPIYLAMTRAAHLGRSAPSAAFIAEYIAVSLVVAALCFSFVEKPATRWLRRREA